MKNILFVCTGNTCRSSMAEAIFKDILKKNDKLDINVKSAGVFAVPSSPASKNAVVVLKEYDIDLSKHKSTQLTQKEIDDSDLILTMTNNHKNLVLKMAPKAKDKVYCLNQYALDKELDINDPFGGDLFVYRRSAYEIKTALENLLNKLRNK